MRLPDDLVEFMDLRVEEGEAPSRAAVIARAVEREPRRTTAERDIAILTGTPRADDLDELAAYAARTELDVE